MAGKMTLAEIEARAKRIIRSACPAELMEIESLATCRETGRVFVVLLCRDAASTARSSDKNKLDQGQVSI